MSIINVISPQTTNTHIKAVYSKYFLVLGAFDLSKPNTKQKQPMTMINAVVTKSNKLEFIFYPTFVTFNFIKAHNFDAR